MAAAERKSSLNKGLFTSTTDDWATPQYIFDELDKEFHFTTDVCADEKNHKCANYFTKEDNGLEQDWIAECYMNPPYGREIGKWVKKAYDAALKGATVVCLLPSRTDTAWFQDFCLKSKDIRFIRGRLKFGDSKNSAPFPSVIVVFSKETIKNG